MIPLIGYSDKLSARPGESIEFKVSSSLPQDFRAELIRTVCADPNPAGPGIIEHSLADEFTATCPSRTQAVALIGSIAACARNGTEYSAS